MSFFVKILLPAITGIAIRIGVTMEKEKITLFRVILSLITGVGFVYLLQGPIVATIMIEYQPLAYGLLAMSGEYIGKFMINRFNLDKIISTIVNKFLVYATNLTGMKIIFHNFLSTILGMGMIYASIMMEFEIWFRIFLILLGIILVFSKDTLFSRLGKLIDNVFNYFNKDNKG